MKIQLIKINNNKFFNMVNTISVFDTLKKKEYFLEGLFDNPFELIFASYKTLKENEIEVNLKGNFKDYNYTRIFDENISYKYYFITKTSTYFLADEEHTKITLLYDEINNSEITTKILAENTKENNMFIYRTNLPKIEPSYNNLIRCSSICKDIDNGENAFFLKEKIIELSNYIPNFYPKKRTNNDDDLRNFRIVLYIKFKAYKTKTKNIASLRMFLMEFCKGGSKLNISDKIFTTLSYINSENVDYITILVPLKNNYLYDSSGNLIEKDEYENKVHFEFDEMQQTLSNMEESADYIDYIALDFIAKNAYYELTNYGQSAYRHTADFNGNEETVCYLVGFDFHEYETDKAKINYTRIGEWPRIEISKSDWESKKWLLPNNYENNHLNYAHKTPFFFCQRWNSKKFFHPIFTHYYAKQIMGVDTTFPAIFGYNKEVELTPFDNNICSNMTSLYLTPTNSITDSNKLSNTTRDNTITALSTTMATGLGMILPIIMGATPAVAVGAAILASTIGGGIGNVIKGHVGLAFKHRDNGIMGISSNGNEKKVINTYGYKEYLPDNKPITKRLDVCVYENYLTNKQIKVIENDRKTYGNFINEFLEYEFNELENRYYIEADIIDFKINNSNVNLTKEIQRRLTNGLFINFNPKPKWNVKLTSERNEIIFEPDFANILKGDIVIINSDTIRTEPNNFVVDDDDEIELISSNNEIINSKEEIENG